MEQSNYKQVKDLFKFATSLDTDEVYEAAGRPYPARALANAITPMIINLGREAGKIDTSITYDPSANGSPSLLLWRGIDDSRRVLVPRLELQETYESATDYIRHEKTIHSLALLALRHAEAMEHLIDELETGQYKPVKPSPYFELPWQEAATSASRGCPAAKHTSPDTLKPAWKDFAVWIGELSLKGIVEHRDAVKPAFLHDITEDAA